MEVITEGVNNINISDASAASKKNRIQVSNTKKPLFFYVNLAKRYMQQHNEVELSALGMAIATVVTIAEILKNNGLAVEKKITTSTVDIREETGGRPVQKAKVNTLNIIHYKIRSNYDVEIHIEILLGKSEKFDELMAAAEEEAINNEEQS
ncbi:Alba domain-containing protein [Citrus sinensis]|uniref:Alba domain-containing protein n=1 Tax=Citrus sinensis TaxID=2711 RepID=A0ACB8NN40_CITSI|nr:Alba domain-containing protein [Citrus sinensis]